MREGDYDDIYLWPIISVPIYPICTNFGLPNLILSLQNSSQFSFYRVFIDFMGFRKKIEYGVQQIGTLFTLDYIKIWQAAYKWLGVSATNKI